MGVSSDKDAWIMRARAAALFGCAGLVVSLSRGSSPKSDIGGLAQALGDEMHGTVRPEDIRWEPSRGPLEDWLFGRFVLFLSADKPGAPCDVVRARVRLSPEGHVIEIADAHDLTSTPLGDDHSLVLKGTHAAFATFAFGQEQSVTALYLGGEGAQNSAETSVDRAMAWLTNVQQTGSGEGVGRVDVSFDAPAKRVGLAIGDLSLSIDAADDLGARRAQLDLDKGELVGVVSGIHAQSARHLPKRLVLWAVDTVRAVPWIGPAPVAWLEERVFALRDRAKMAAFKLHGDTPEDTLAAPNSQPIAIIDSSGIATDDGAWPPKNIPSIWNAELGEGEWRPWVKPWLRKFPATAGVEAPTPFMTTYVRPDEARPYSHVMLVEMDMRQLDLEMEAGTDDPKPLTGQHGPGRLPRDPAVMTRVVAAFNGAFKSEHGNYGMMVHKRVLLPPQPFAATVILTDDGRAGLGTWGATPDIGGLVKADGVGIPDASIVSYRQNLDPLVDRGEVNPTGRALWGYTLPGNGMQTERTGICVTFAGHMIYAWGDDASATTIGKAFQMAGCDYGLHLDMNPHHTGFIFTTINALKGHDYHSELLTPLMEISTDRYIEYAPKDFFYMLMRDPTPRTGGVAWAADPGTQPAPAWAPSVWRGKSESVDVVMLEPDRAGFRVAAGSKEPDAGTGAEYTHQLADDDSKRVVWSIGLGTATTGRPMGLSLSGKNVLASSEDHDTARLVVRASGAAQIALVDETAADVAGEVDVIELPLLADKGAVQPGASLVSTTHGKDAPTTRAALGVTDERRVMIAIADTTPIKLAEALTRLGCKRVVLLDRGAHATTTVRRAGTAKPPLARSEETTLFALGLPMRPRGFKFTSATAKK